MALQLYMFIPTHALPTQPPDHLLDAPYEPFLLFLWVCVIVAEVSDTTVSLGIAKIEVDGFGMADM